MDEPIDGPSQTCPRCRDLEAEVAALREQLEAIRAAAEDHPAAEPLVVQALRLLDGGWGAGWELRPSPVRRHWMGEHPTAYQCLPMVVANQWGWQVLCPTDVCLAWNGGPNPEHLRVDVDPQWTGAILSQFGRGIVTFSPPWLFRTPPGWDLYAKGPSNRWKPNCIPLEGVIETWWLNYTFTLNWKLLEPGIVTFARGESLAQLVPVPHATFQGAAARESPIGAVEPAAVVELLRWRAERRRIANEPVKTHRLYLKAEEIEEHLTRVPVPPFIRTWGAKDAQAGEPDDS